MNQLKLSGVNEEKSNFEVILDESQSFVTEIRDSLFSGKIIQILAQDEKGENGYLEIKITGVDKNEKDDQIVGWFLTGYTVSVSVSGKAFLRIKWDFVGYLDLNRNGFLIVFCYKNKQKGGE